MMTLSIIPSLPTADDLHWPHSDHQQGGPQQTMYAQPQQHVDIMRKSGMLWYISPTTAVDDIPGPRVS